MYKFYKLNDVLSFGIYKDKSILEICAINPKYLEWCLINLEHFYLSDEVENHLAKLSPSFKISSEAEAAVEKKLDRLEEIEIEIHGRKMDQIWKAESGPQWDDLV